MTFFFYKFKRSYLLLNVNLNLKVLKEMYIVYVLKMADENFCRNKQLEKVNSKFRGNRNCSIRESGDLGNIKFISRCSRKQPLASCL